MSYERDMDALNDGEKKDTDTKDMSEEKESEIVEKFNVFIKKWCGNSYPHLIDSDDNDGEDFRDEIKSLESRLTQEHETVKSQNDCIIAQEKKIQSLEQRLSQSEAERDGLLRITHGCVECSGMINQKEPL